jgi:hypothetical protein
MRTRDDQGGGACWERSFYLAVHEHDTGELRAVTHDRGPGHAARGLGARAAVAAKFHG